MPSETLTCEFDGHTWARERTRGKKPRFCDAHKPNRGEAAPAKPAATNESRSRASTEALELLTGGRFIPEEHRRKMEAVVYRLDDPAYLARRAKGDIELMVETQDRLVEEYERRWGHLHAAA